MNINLSYPELLEGQEFLTETDPKVLKKLIENDGTSNLDSDIKRITQLLHDINRCPKSLSSSEAILKLFHSKYSSFSSSLRDYSNDNLKERSEADELMHDLTREMTFAYKAYLNLLNEQNKWVFGLPKKQAFGANYAMHYLSLLKAEHYNFERSLPSYLWQELFDLYQYAEINKLTKIKIKDPTDNPLSVSITIQNTFVRASLMASMEPYLLKRVEIWNLFHKLNGFINDVQIGNDSNMIKESHCFAFNFKYAERPKLLKAKKNHDKNSRYINIDSFADKVKSELKLFNTNMPQKYPFLSANNSTLQEKLLQIMYKYSVQYIARSSDRYPIDVETKAVFGFQDIMHLIKSNIDLSIFPDSKADTELVRNANGGHQITWQMVNESQGGACIKQEQISDFYIKELTPMVVSKRLPSKEGAWKFAMSRWSKPLKSHTKVGLKYIKGNLCLASNVNDPGQDFLFIGPDTKGVAFLLTPKAALKDTKNFVLSVDDKKILVCKNSVFPFADSNLIKIEIIKKSS